jgi:hypothetical protein
MASRRLQRQPLFRLSIAAPLALLLAGGCGLITAVDASGPFAFGSGGRPIDGISGTATGSGAGGGSLSYDAGSELAQQAPLTSYQYLCGGSSSACLPGASTDLCAPGGNPGVGGSAPDASALSCRLVSNDGGPVAAVCGMGGGGANGDPCMTATDCGAELGCIGTSVSGVGICRPYCCASLESCPTDTYCVKTPMAEAPANEIPVCVPAMPCALLDDAQTCPPNTTCTIVRESGTTSCVTPGTGTYGEPCPCAAGYTCSWADGTCLKLCHTGSAECGTNGYCQGGLDPYPQGIGYCVWY